MFLELILLCVLVLQVACRCSWVISEHFSLHSPGRLLYCLIAGLSDLCRLFALVQRCVVESVLLGVEPPTRRQLGDALEAHALMLARHDAMLMMLCRVQAGGPQCKCGHITPMHVADKDKCMAFVEVLGQYKQCECMGADVNRVPPATKIITGVR